MCRNWRIPCRRTWSAWRLVSSQLSGEPWDSSPIAAPSSSSGLTATARSGRGARAGHSAARRKRRRRRQLRPAGAPSGRSRRREGPLRSPARGPCRPGDRLRGPARRADTEAEDGRAGWAALGPAASPVARSGSHPAPAPRRRRRTPQPRCGSGSGFSLPVSCTGFFLLVTKTCAATEHAQSPYRLTRGSGARSVAPDFIGYGRRRGKKAVQERRRGRTPKEAPKGPRRRRAQAWLGRSQREGAGLRGESEVWHAFSK